ncbi:Hypothetical protein AJAP_24320 [Amycolatopsis japonica]|uniref:Uncharacterized protein n=1 Tax=Amycolatopsis japonica TaxID=208439 RepID=A0A075UXJ2_9PSEU|nr:hypothetical protein [Amycolatopsis japonica]AIG77713.1 Hypothetical protein AJAP_24320 [Amycolatopsis japonica]
MKSFLRAFSAVAITIILAFSGATHASATEAEVDCNPSFASDYAGRHIGNGRYNVKITYVDVARFFGSQSGTIDITMADGTVLQDFNGSPSGGTIPVDFNYDQRGDWQANLFHANGGALCAQRFKVLAVIEGE